MTEKISRIPSYTYEELMAAGKSELQRTTQMISNGWFYDATHNCWALPEDKHLEVLRQMMRDAVQRVEALPWNPSQDAMKAVIIAAIRGE